VLAFGGEVGVFANLWELALEQVCESVFIQFSVELDVSHKQLRHVFECVAVAEAEDLLQVLVAAFGGLAGSLAKVVADISLLSLH